MRKQTKRNIFTGAACLTLAAPLVGYLVVMNGKTMSFGQFANALTPMLAALFAAVTLIGYGVYVLSTCNMLDNDEK